MTKLCKKNNHSHQMIMEPLTPRKSTRRNSFCSRSNNRSSKNPYSNQGLDKFSALLSELEEKRQQIYSQMGSDDISLVRFVYKDSDDCVPVVVKVKKDKKLNKSKSDVNKASHKKHDLEIKEKFPIDSITSAADHNKEEKRAGAGADNKVITKKMRFAWDVMKLSNWKKPSYYLPTAVVLILLFLVFFGRSFVILCTSIGWYIIPALMEDSSSNVKRPTNKKKEYARRFSDKKMAANGVTSPRSINNNSGAVKDQSPRKHGHRKSW